MTTIIDTYHNVKELINTIKNSNLTEKEEFLTECQLFIEAKEAEFGYEGKNLIQLIETMDTSHEGYAAKSKAIDSNIRVFLKSKENREILFSYLQKVNEDFNQTYAEPCQMWGSYKSRGIRNHKLINAKRAVILTRLFFNEIKKDFKGLKVYFSSKAGRALNVEIKGKQSDVSKITELKNILFDYINSFVDTVKGKDYSRRNYNFYTTVFTTID